jgi:hypothetical protein
MPEKATMERARRRKREGKAPSTQAGEFIREEIDKVRAGEHGVRNTKQAIAIGLSKARRAGVKLAPPKEGRGSETVRRKAKQDLKAGARPHKTSAKRSRATLQTLKQESRKPVSSRALSQQARSAAQKRTRAERSSAARKAARTRAARRKS